MYSNHFKLTRKPFRITADPDFLWLGEQHKEALAFLKYGVMDDKGLLLLSGDAGTGKTTLINALVDSLDDDVVVARIPDPALDLTDFHHLICLGFGIDTAITTKADFMLHLRQFLLALKKSGKRALLLIDEAQRLVQELLEEIRLLSNIETRDAKLLNIFLIGQIELHDVLLQPENRALRQRITINYTLAPLNETETADYIAHRLAVAGGREAIFDGAAQREIYLFSGGCPRLINIVCDHALLTGYARGVYSVDGALIRESAAELTLESSPAVAAAAAPAPARSSGKKKGSVLSGIQNGLNQCSEQLAGLRSYLKRLITSIKDRDRSLDRPNHHNDRTGSAAKINLRFGRGALIFGIALLTFIVFIALLFFSSAGQRFGETFSSNLKYLFQVMD